MRLRHLLLPLFVAPLLAACVNDTASYSIDGTPEHSLSLVREQPVFWNDKVNLSLIVSRMPNCVRRHSLGSGTAKTLVEVWQVPSGAFIIRVGKRMYATETQTCEGFARLDADPVTGMGELRGVFRLNQGQLAFVPKAAPGVDAGAE
ncbi:hypothetical protein [Azonexus sp.]|jgi:hypothetical protein|uniref:hypothetical protein n=1 Tax=Azonexus sp. TaxID=1872668 RepID=UPI00281EA5E1|nr:hypothetical protein [Azonexus sp.]MDR1996686.1 hypothetical protein [Azonexus sp.]